MNIESDWIIRKSAIETYVLDDFYCIVVWSFENRVYHVTPLCIPAAAYAAAAPVTSSSSSSKRLREVSLFTDEAAETVVKNREPISREPGSNPREATMTPKPPVMDSVKRSALKSGNVISSDHSVIIAEPLFQHARNVSFLRQPWLAFGAVILLKKVII